MLRAQLRMESRGWGSDVLGTDISMSRSQRSETSANFWDTHLCPLNFRGRKGLGIIKFSLSRDRYTT
jgi:hypothetical protein